jgi:phosphopantetheine adenylyltransferase
MSEHVTLGVTSDFDWYELNQIKQQLDSLSSRVHRLLDVIQERERTQAEYVIYLKRQCDELRAQLNALRKD